MKLWKKKVARMYQWLVLTVWPAGLWYAYKHPHYKEIDDARFSYYLAEGLYSKFLAELDSSDKEIFAEQLRKGAGATFYKSDHTPMKEIVDGGTFPGTYAAASIALLRKDGDNPPRAVAIYLPAQKLMLTPEDSNRHAWNLARYFVLQGAAHRINLIDHAIVHFPSDPINAISKTILPKNHLLLKLLLPHFYLSLPVNYSVLEGAASLINRTKWVIYAPFTAPGAVIRRLLPYGYVGGDKAAYPPYSFPTIPSYPPSHYGEFLKAYRDTIRGFVARVVQHLVENAGDGGPDLMFVSLWADHISQWVPGFPNGEEIWKDGADGEQSGTLIDAVTTIIWDVSIAHATDHEALHSMPKEEVPFRVRVEPPTSSEMPAYDQKKLNKWWDIFQSWLTDRLFYMPHNQSLLKDVDYGFDDPALQQLNKQFCADLLATERTLREQGVVPIFAPLEHVATSIQY
jgi:hypothetical protein